MSWPLNKMPLSNMKLSKMALSIMIKVVFKRHHRAESCYTEFPHAERFQAESQGASFWLASLDYAII